MGITECSCFGATLGDWLIMLGCKKEPDDDQGEPIINANHAENPEAGDGGFGEFKFLSLLSQLPGLIMSSMSLIERWGSILTLSECMLYVCVVCTYNRDEEGKRSN